MALIAASIAVLVNLRSPSAGRPPPNPFPAVLNPDGSAPANAAAAVNAVAADPCNAARRVITTKAHLNPNNFC
jgi:hypothetical protein